MTPRRSSWRMEEVEEHEQEVTVLTTMDVSESAAIPDDDSGSVTGVAIPPGGILGELAEMDSDTIVWLEEQVDNGKWKFEAPREML